MGSRLIRGIEKPVWGCWTVLLISFISLFLISKLFVFKEFQLIEARVAQLVEQRTENPRVGGSNPPPGTTFLKNSHVNHLNSSS